MKRIPQYSLLCLLLLTSCLRAEVVVKGDTKVPVHGMADLTVTLDKEGEKTQYLWKFTSGDPVKVVTLGKRILFSGPPGVYKLSCTVADFKAEILTGADVTVVIGGKEPGPGPEPEPTPTDPLVLSLKKAYTEDTGKDKVKDMAGLAAVYTQGSKMDLKNLPNVKALYEVLIEVSRKMLPADSLKGVRKIVGDQLRTVLPSDTAAALTDEHRQRLASLFARLGDALTEASK